MKEIKAYIRPDRIRRVADALIKRGMLDITIGHVEEIGDGRNSKHSKISIITQKLYSLTVKLETLCSDEEAPEIVALIQQEGHTGQEGDGVVFVLDVSEVVNVRTGIHGEEALAQI